MKLILPTELADTIQPCLPDRVSIVWADPDGNLDGDASNAEVYFNGFWLKQTILRSVFAAAPRLRCQHRLSAGVNHILTSTFMERDIILTNIAGVRADAIPIAEIIMAFILYAKQLSSLRSLQAQHQWRSGNSIARIK